MISKMSWKDDDDEAEYGLVAIKRDWVPDWLFSIFAYHDLYPLGVIDLIAIKWLPFRYIFTVPIKKQH
jgi:hypothetical protein